MTFLTLVGGILIFGALWLVFPRVAFVWVLSFYLKHQHNVMLFDGDADVITIIASGLILLAGMFGALLDIFIDVEFLID